MELPKIDATTQLQSATIDLLRFPLIILVIFIHVNPNVVNLIDADFNLISAHGIYNVTGIVLSHVISHIAVPSFYLISGFLFFTNFQSWSWDGYQRKMRSRVQTLLIPYVLWNLVPFILMILSKLGGVLLLGKPIDDVQSFISDTSWHCLYDCNEWGTTRINWLGENLRMTGPYDLPLWFLRDLIVVTILTPVIYVAVRKLKAFILVILFIAYISRIWTLLPGFHIAAFFFFTIGAYFALNKINIVLFADKYKHLFIPLSTILLIIITIYDGANTIIGQNIYPLFICCGVFTAFYIASICIAKFNVKPNKFLISSCFFVYAFHGVCLPMIGTPLSFIQKILHIVIPGKTGLEEGICYLLSPFITALLCILVLVVARRIQPRTALLFSGYK